MQGRAFFNAFRTEILIVDCTTQTHAQPGQAAARYPESCFLLEADHPG